MKNGLHFILVVFLCHEDVVPDSSMHDPGFLRAVGSGSTEENLGLRKVFGLVEKREEEGGFPAGNVTEEEDELSFGESQVDVSEDYVQIGGEGGLFFG